MIALLLTLALAAAPDAGARAVSPKKMKSPVKITADRFETLGKEQKMLWLGHVKVHRDGTLVDCDRLTAFYTKEQEVSRIECDGNVQAVEGERRAQGQHADFDNTTGVLVVTGDEKEPRVEAWQGKSHLRGRKATFLVGSDTLEVEHAETVIEGAAVRDSGATR